MSHYVLEYAPTFDDPPAMPRSSRLWHPPPGHIIPADGHSSVLGALGGAPCKPPHSRDILPRLLPRFGNGAYAVDAATIAAMGDPTVNEGDWLVVAAVFVAWFDGGYTLDPAYSFPFHGGEIYGGSTGFEIPPVLAHGVLAHVEAAATGTMDQVNGPNFYVSPGPHSWEIWFALNDGQRAYPFAGLTSMAGVAPGWIYDVYGDTIIWHAHRGDAPADFVVRNPSWLPVPAVGGYMGAMFKSFTYPAFAEALNGTIRGRVKLTLTYYNIGGPANLSIPAGYRALTSISASDRGGCC